MFYLDKGNNALFYKDLRPLQDDKTILTNPHKGWYLHYLDGGLDCGAYNCDIPEGDYLEDVPGLNMLLLRLLWTDIEVAPGVYDWTAIDDIMARWGAHGYTFGFHFATYMGRQEQNATPKWVFDEGAKHFVYDKLSIPVYEPVYNDPIYMKHLEAFIAECGRKLNGHPLVEYVDIGTYGTWGEGNTVESFKHDYDLATLKWHLDLHLRYFPDTLILVNDDMISELYCWKQPENFRWFTEYCINMGLGMRDDSISVDSHVRQYGYDTLKAPELHKMFSKNARVDLEFAHYDHSADFFRYGYPHIEACRNACASRAGFHGFVKKWYAKHKDLHDYLANRLGYWYFPEGYTISDELINGVPACMELTISNRGYARAYKHFDLKVALKDPNGTITVINTDRGNNTSWLPGETYKEWIHLSLKGIAAGEYRLLLGLFDGEQVVKMALTDTVYCDGYYEIGKITVR